MVNLGSASTTQLMWYGSVAFVAVGLFGMGWAATATGTSVVMRRDEESRTSA